MTTPTRQASPLAHGPDTDCPSCRDCSSCDGGTGTTAPATYRLEHHGTPGPGAVLIVCARCDGTGTTCLNLAKEPRP